MEKSFLENLQQKGLLIEPENLEPYLNNFKDYETELKTNLASEKFWNDKRVLITGISGFAGSHLAEKLLELKAKVIGFIRRHAVPEYPNITHLMNKIELVEGSLQDINSLYAVLENYQPEVIFHLGAQSFVPTSFRTPIETFDINIMGTANLLEALRRSDIDVEGVHIACSSEEYGMVFPNEVPIKETNLLRPLSPYAASKVAADKIAETYHKCYGIPSVIVRAFNHTGPRRGLQFVTSVITRQIASISLKKTDKVVIGNMEPIRDFTDVRDIVQGYLLAIEKAKRGQPYNLGHGWGISIGNLIKLAANVEGIEKYKIEVDKKRFREAEVEILLCDYTKAKEEIGYRPRIPLTKAVKDNIEYFKKNQHLLSIERH